MEAQDFKQHILDLIKSDERIYSAADNEYDYAKLFELIDEYDAQLLDMLFDDAHTRDKFFVAVNNTTIFKSRHFKFFIEENKVNNSYTEFKNKIGLSSGKRFIKDNTEVVIDFPFKDCILAGGQTTEEGMDTYFEYSDKAKEFEKKSAKRKEVFFNQVLAQDEIDRLLDDKALVNWKRYTAEGEAEVSEIKRDEDGTIRENLIIKGNNLLALHSLRKNFAGKVKLIYIDPPYNTGNDGFKYNDKFNHSTWLTFMKNRLEIAKELLREDGAIFVQCDDNEQAYLKVLMDEVYGRENFIAILTLVSDARTRHYEALSKTHEFICIYSKTKYYELFQISNNDKKFQFNDENGGYDLYELRNRNSDFNINNRPNLFYPFYLNPNNMDANELFEISLEEKEGWEKVLPQPSKGIQTVWRWGKEKSYLNLNIVLFGRKANYGYQIVKKYREKSAPVSSVWSENDILTDRGTMQLKQLFGSKRFNFPKPEELIKKIIEISTKEEDIVLDFHLGSGTTAAVAHKMGRQYIGIEQMDYIENISVERLKKVIDGEQGGISKAAEWSGGGEFIYLELAEWNEAAKKKILESESTEELNRLFAELCDKYFLHYNVKVEEFKTKLTKTPEFLALTIEQQKEMFIEMLDLNQLYVNFSEIEDSRFAISEKDIALSKKFYGKEG